MIIAIADQKRGKMKNISVNDFEKFLKDNQMITGGHFMLLPDEKANLNEGTIKSFGIAAELYTKSKEKKLKCGFGILINNIGSVCDFKKKVCVLNPEDLKEFSLPEEYGLILKKLNINKKELHIFWEKSLRNLGKKKLVDELKKENKYIKLIEGKYWLVDDDKGLKITLSRPNPNDKYGTPACPLIMAAYSKDMERKSFKKSLNIYYVDSDNEENIPNYFAIEKGRIVSEYLFDKDIEIKNIYLFNDKIISNL